MMHVRCRTGMQMLGRDRPIKGGARAICARCRDRKLAAAAEAEERLRARQERKHHARAWALRSRHQGTSCRHTEHIRRRSPKP